MDAGNTPELTTSPRWAKLSHQPCNPTAFSQSLGWLIYASSFLLWSIWYSSLSQLMILLLIPLRKISSKNRDVPILSSWNFNLPALHALIWSACSAFPPVTRPTLPWCWIHPSLCERQHSSNSFLFPRRHRILFYGIIPFNIRHARISASDTLLSSTPPSSPAAPVSLPIIMVRLF